MSSLNKVFIHSFDYLFVKKFRFSRKVIVIIENGQTCFVFCSRFTVKIIFSKILPFINHSV